MDAHNVLSNAGDLLRSAATRSSMLACASELIMLILLAVPPWVKGPN